MAHVSYNPRHLAGFGLSEGEVMECLWSFARCFLVITKEMRTSHRIDVLTDGFLFYGQKTIVRLRKFYSTLQGFCLDRMKYVIYL